MRVILNGENAGELQQGCMNWHYVSWIAVNCVNWKLSLSWIACGMNCAAAHWGCNSNHGAKREIMAKPIHDASASIHIKKTYSPCVLQILICRSFSWGAFLQKSPSNSSKKLLKKYFLFKRQAFCREPLLHVLDELQLYNKYLIASSRINS